jgi:hypothetical protein
MNLSRDPVVGLVGCDYYELQHEWLQSLEFRCVATGRCLVVTKSRLGVATGFFPSFQRSANAIQTTTWSMLVLIVLLNAYKTNE